MKKKTGKVRKVKDDIGAYGKKKKVGYAEICREEIEGALPKAAKWKK